MANQITIDIGAAANDGTGDPLRTAFNYVNNNFSNVWNTGLPNSNVQFSDNRILTVNTNANLILAPNGIGKVASNVDIVPNTANVFALGSPTRRWNTVYGQYLDLSHNATIGGNLVVTGNLSAGNISYTSNVFVGDLEGSVFDGASSIVLDVIDSAIYVDNYRYANGTPVTFGGTPGGSNTQVQFNDNGSFGGSASFTFDKTSNVLSVSGNILAGNIIPTGNATQSLGSATRQWADLYVSNATIFMNNVPLSLNSSNVLTVNGADVVTTNANGQANIGNLDITGTYVSIASGAAETIITISPNIEGQAYLQIPDDATANAYDVRMHNDAGNIELGTGSGSYNWYFGNTGTLTLPNGANISGGNLNAGSASASVALNAFSPDGNTVSIQAQGNSSSAVISVFANAGPTTNTWTFNTAGTITLPNGGNIRSVDELTIINSTTTANGVIGINARESTFGESVAQIYLDGTDRVARVSTYNPNTEIGYDWTFDAGGSLTIPTAPGNIYMGTNTNGPFILPTSLGIELNANRADAAQDYISVSQDGVNIFSVNTINIENNTTGLNNSDININSGDDIFLRGRNKVDDDEAEGGDINIWAGQGSNATSSANDPFGGGDIQIQGGLGGSGTGAGANGSTGGFVSIVAGQGGTSVDSNVGSGGDIEIAAGSAPSAVDTAHGGIGGGVSITAGDTTRINEIGGTISLNTGSASGDGTGAAGYVEINIPSSNVGPGGTWTFGGTGTSLNVPANSEIFGPNFGNFTVGCAGNTIVTSSDYGANVKNWVFGYTGNLVVPGPITQDSYDSANLIVATTADTNWAYGFTTNGSTDFYSQIKFYGDGSATRGVKLLDTASGASWTFDGTGTLTLPGEGIIQSLNDTVILQSKDTGTGNTYSARLGTTGGLYFETTEYPLGWLSITNNAGNANITAASGTAGGAGKNIYITAGFADQGDYYTTPGGDVNITGGLGATNDGGGGGPGGNVNITAGLSADPAGAPGNINITSGPYDWIFNNNGDTVLPGGGYIGANNDFVSLYSNIQSELDGISIQGNSVTTITNQSNVSIVADEGGDPQTWTFDNTGTLTAPGAITTSSTVSGQVLMSTQSAANEGGEIQLALPSSGTTLTGNIIIDSYQNSIRFFESGNSRGLYVDTPNVSVSGQYAIGYRDVPQIALSGNVTANSITAGKHFYSTTAGNLQVTIPDNANVAFPLGATLTIVMNAAGNVIVAQGTGVSLYMAGSSTTGNRTVGAYGLASVMKVATDTWVISGTGVY